MIDNQHPKHAENGDHNCGDRLSDAIVTAREPESRSPP
jgi:hypothetical protein